MHEKLNIHPFTPFKIPIGTKNLVNDNDAKDRKIQISGKEDDFRSLASLSKNTNKTKSVMSKLRYAFIISIDLFTL